MSETEPLAPVLARVDEQLPGELPRGAEIPEDQDPLADGILMRHQAKWLEDQSELKIAEKGRRTGITYAEALDDTLIAASARSAGGDNVFYIGDTKDKGREFIGYVAHFAKVVAKETAEVEEFLFEDRREDGSSKHISAYRVQFASGFRVEALSSRPDNIRGLQGVVVIDEAAFHQDVRAVLDAVNALLIWGGRIRVISTHNGVLNPFNELIREAKAGKNGFKVHFIPFSAAVENGLFRRVCLMRGKPWSQKAQDEWEAKIRGAYGTRTAQMQQELDGIPSDGDGAALPRVVIEAVTDRRVEVVRLQLPDAFVASPEPARRAHVNSWLLTTMLPVLEQLDPARRHDLGWDFAREGDVSGLVVTELGRDTVRHQRFVLELRKVPFEHQRDIALFIVPRLPRFGHGAFDATGNGAYLGEVVALKFGARISALKLTQDWYRENGQPYVTAFGDRSITVAADEDVIRDHQALQYVGGVVRVPKDMRFKGGDGLFRHGDTAIAGMLAWYASRQGAVLYDYEPVEDPRHAASAGGGGRGWRDRADGPGDDDDSSGWREPLGRRLRTGGAW